MSRRLRTRWLAWIVGQHEKSCHLCKRGWVRIRVGETWQHVPRSGVSIFLASNLLTTK